VSNLCSITVFVFYSLVGRLNKVKNISVVAQ